MYRFRISLGVTAILVVFAVGVWMALGARPSPEPRDPAMVGADGARVALYWELQPVPLKDCTFQRYGEPNDGGYLLCGNLLRDVQAAYSYGIAGYDGWGCDVSRDLRVRVHQYDCFDLTQPSCPGGDTVFHPACIAADTYADAKGRSFDTLQNQLAANGDAGRTLLVKMDVEGAEWRALLHAPEELLQRIDQLAIELHGFRGDFETYLQVVRKLKKSFYVAHLHFNNYSCADDLQPLPAHAYELLFVNKRLTTPAAPGEVTRPHPLDTPSNPEAPDCQYAAGVRRGSQPRAAAPLREIPVPPADPVRQ